MAAAKVGVNEATPLRVALSSEEEDDAARYYDAEAGVDLQPLSGCELSILASMEALTGCSATIYVPVMLQIVEDLNTTPFLVNMSLMLNWLVAGGTAVFWGLLSDASGRRPSAACGLLIFVSGTLLSGLATNVTQLIAGRVLQGIGEGMGQTIPAAIIRDGARDASERRKILADMYGLISIAMGVAPALGGILGAIWGWRSNFHFLTAWGFLCIFNVTCCLRETNVVAFAVASTAAAFSDALAEFCRKIDYALQSPRTRASIVTIAALYGSRGGSVTLLTYCLQRYFGQTVLMTGVWIGVESLSFLLAGFLQGRIYPTNTVPELEAYSDASTAVLGSYGCLVAALAALCLVGYDFICLASLGVPLGVDSFGVFLLLGTAPGLTALLLGSQPPDIAGALAGFFGSLKMFFFALGSLVATLLCEILTPAAAVGAPSVLFANLALWYVPSTLAYWLFVRRPVADRDKPLYYVASDVASPPPALHSPPAPRR